MAITKQIIEDLMAWKIFKDIFFKHIELKSWLHIRDS